MAEINRDEYHMEVANPVADAKAKKAHSEMRYCGVADFCQNMEFPFLSKSKRALRTICLLRLLIASE